jgi:hypothetical protein
MPLEESLIGVAKTDAQKFPMTAKLYSYWEKLPSSPRPMWSSVDLMTIFDIAPWMFVADVVRSEMSLRFVYRFVGTKIVDAFGLDPTGMSADEAFEGDRLTLMTEAYTYIINSKKAQLGFRQQANKQRGFVRMAVLTVPLYDQEGTVNMLMGINDFSIMNETERHEYRGEI